MFAFGILGHSLETGLCLFSTQGGVWRYRRSVATGLGCGGAAAPGDAPARVGMVARCMAADGDRLFLWTPV